MAETQIPDAAKAALETYVKRRGVKMALVIKEALLHYLQALREFPEDIIVPARLVLSAKSMREVADHLGADEESSADLKALFQG